MRADGVLGDEQPPRDLVRAEVLVQQEQDLDLAGAELVRRSSRARRSRADRPRGRGRGAGGRSRPTAPPRRGDALEELGDPVRRLGLEQVAGRPARIAASRFSSEPEAVRTTTSHAARQPGPSAAPPAHPRPAWSGRAGRGRAAARARARSPRRRPRPRRRPERVLLEQADERRARQRVVVDDERAAAHVAVIGRRPPCRQDAVCGRHRAKYRTAWVRDEVLLVGAARRRADPVPRAARACATLRPPEPAAVPRHRDLLVSLIVSVLAYVRFSRRAAALRPLPASAGSS